MIAVTASFAWASPAAGAMIADSRAAEMWVTPQVDSWR